MELFNFNISRSRITRHVLFWLTWIISFTFIKSFGAPMDVYLAWFVYYISTLPVFLGHTYIIVYWMGQKLVKGYKIVFFVVLFLLSIYIFSCIELLISHEVLSKWFPAIFETGDFYLTTGNILISGIGNLYIVLVFIAGKMIRKWYNSSEEKKNLSQLHLEDRVAEVNSRIQPGLLMYASEKIEELAERESEDISAAIAILSEILNGTMLTKERDAHRIDEELKLLRKLVKLHAVFNHNDVPAIQVQGADLNHSNVPALALFSLMEIVLRYCKATKKISLDIITAGTPFCAKICLDTEETQSSFPDLVYIREQMDQFFPDRFALDQRYENHQYILGMEETGIHPCS